MSLGGRRLFGSTLAMTLAVALGTSSPANADEKLTKNECVSASERAIGLKSAGRLREARDQLVRCGRDECPGILREDCATGLRTIDDRLPTVVFGARDESGKDIVDAKILVDDESGGGSAIDGRARTFDPGRHEVHVLRGAAVVANEIVVLREGEKNRVVSITLKGPPKKASTETAPSGLAIPPYLPIILGSVGIVGLGIAGGLSLHLDTRIDEAKGSCAPGCSPDERASLSTQLVAANVSMIVGITALLAAGATFLLMKMGPPPPTKAASRPLVWNL
jgi:hypothetical protein